MRTESKPRKPVSLQFLRSVHDRVRDLASREELPLNRIYERAVEHCLDLPPEKWLRRKNGQEAA